MQIFRLLERIQIKICNTKYIFLLRLVYFSLLVIFINLIFVNLNTVFLLSFFIFLLSMIIFRENIAFINNFKTGKVKLSIKTIEFFIFLF